MSLASQRVVICTHLATVQPHKNHIQLPNMPHVMSFHNLPFGRRRLVLSVGGSLFALRLLDSGMFRRVDTSLLVFSGRTSLSSARWLGIGYKVVWIVAVIVVKGIGTYRLIPLSLLLCWFRNVLLIDIGIRHFVSVRQSKDNKFMCERKSEMWQRVGGNFMAMHFDLLAWFLSCVIA